MYLLAVETSSARGGVALASDGRLVAEESFAEGLVHGREVAARIDDLLARTGVAAADLGVLAVSVGPGSYTGIRVGVTAVKTLAFALRLPIVAVSSLEVIAEGARERALGETFRTAARIAVLLDGKQRQLYWALFEAGAEPDLRRLTNDAVLDLGRLSRPTEDATSPIEADLFVGDGADAYAAALEDGARRLLRRGGADDDWPRASSLVRRAARRHAAGNVLATRDAIHALAPVYLRVSEAERRLAQRQRRPSDGGEQ